MKWEVGELPLRGELIVQYKLGSCFFRNLGQVIEEEGIVRWMRFDSGREDRKIHPAPGIGTVSREEVERAVLKVMGEREKGMDSGDESVGWVKKPDIPYLGKPAPLHFVVLEDKDYLGITKGDMVKKILQLEEENGELKEENRQLKEEIGEGDIWQES